MFKALPLKAVWPEDSRTLGEEIALLAKLRHHDQPVPEGVVISPPRDEIKAFLEHHQWLDSQSLEHHSGEIKRQALKIEPPVELKQLISGHSIRLKELWERLLMEWLEEMKSAAARGVKFPVTAMSAKYCLFTGAIKASGKAYFDRASQDTEIVIDSGKLAAPQLKELHERVLVLRKIFLKDYIYHWVWDGTIQFSRVVPYTETELVSTEPASVASRVKGQAPVLPTTATKVFWNLDSLVVDPRSDGVVLAAETTAGIEELRFKLVETAHSFVGKEVILKFGHYPSEFGVGGGCFELLQRKSLLEREVEAVLLARNKRQLLNVSVALPLVRSVAELMEMKRTLSAIGITRKGSLKLWMEVMVPENLINFDQYAMVGIDGVILNLDSLQAWLGGFNPDMPESMNAKVNVQALGLFLETYLRKVTKVKLPILVTGQLLQSPEMLKLLVKLGIWGILPHPANSEEMRWQLAKLEKVG